MDTLSILGELLAKFLMVNLFVFGLIYVVSKSADRNKMVLGYISMAVVIILARIAPIAILLGVIFYFFAPEDSLFFTILAEAMNIIAILFISFLLWLKFSSVQGNRVKDKHKQTRQDLDYDFFLQIEREALKDTPQPEALWQYSILLRQLNQSQIKIHWSKETSTEKINALADQYFDKALQKQSLSAIYQNANQQICSSISESKIINVHTIEDSLDQLIETLKVQCQIEYPVINNQSTYNHKSPHWDLRDIVKGGSSSFTNSHGLSETILDYPSLHNRCDILQLRQNVACEKQEKAVYMLLTCLINSPILPSQYNWHSPLRHSVYLSVLAELLKRFDIVDLLDKQGLEQDEILFSQQRQTLINEYQQAFGDSVSIGSKT